MRVISILNSKGGVGKSTLSCHLARAFQLLPARVLLLDTAPALLTELGRYPDERP